MKTQLFKTLAASAIVTFCSIASAAPKVVADIPPVHALIAKVMEGVGTPSLLTPGTSSPHGYNLRPSEAAVLADADLLIWIGPGLTPWLDRARQKINPNARNIKLLEAPGATQHETRSMEDFGADDHHHHDHHEHGRIDPHAWLDPNNAALWLDVIAAALADADPANRATYVANSEAGKAEIAALSNAIQKDLQPVRARPFIVLHDAFQYFEQRFDLTVVGAIRGGDGAAPGAKRIDRLLKAIERTGATCLFREPQFSSRLAAALAVENVQMAILDPLGAKLEPGWALYPALIRNLADAIVACQTPK